MTEVHKDFADWYREASVAPSLDELELRCAAVENAAKAASTRPSDTVDLIEAVYGLGRQASDVEWFIAALKQVDPTLRLVENDHALKVLAACVLASLMANEATDWSDVANGLICASFSGQRSPTVLPELLTIGSRCVSGWQVRNRVDADIAPPTVHGLDAKKLDEAYQGVTGAFDAVRVVEGMKVVAGQASLTLAANGREIVTYCKALLKRTEQQREEIDMLWWVLGGWIEEVDQPLASLPAAAAPLAAGWRIGRLVRTHPQPRSLPAIIARALGRAGEGHEVSLAEAVEAVPSPAKAAWGAAAAASAARFGRIAPVTFALGRAAELPDTWRTSFERTTGLDASFRLPPRGLAMQLAREQVMISQFGS